MGVYIKGMEMPKSCAGCYMFLHGIDMDGTPWHECAVADRETDNPFGCGKPDWCPLVEVSPHGRLIDADAVIDLVMQYCPDDDGVCSKAGADLRELLDEIENLPTVIPAEPPKEGE